jgi:hypothetical protein
MLAVGLAAVAIAAHAQDSDDESLEPAVDTSAVLDDETASPEASAPAAAVAEDVTRDESGPVVMDRLELGRTEITGNQELPKVLYIVPWQKSDPGELAGRPVNTLLDEVLAPLDREEFVRQVKYYEDLYGDPQEPAKAGDN